MASPINLHIHTTHSDGGNAVAEIVIMLKDAGGELGLDESWIIHILGYGFDLDLMREKLAELKSKECKPAIKEGIKIIHDCGGLAILAHPYTIYLGGKRELSQEQVGRLLHEISAYGIDGMEVYYQQYTQEQIDWLNKWADYYGFYRAVGTDYHNFQVDLSKYSEYIEVGNRDSLVFDAVTPDSQAGSSLLRRIISPSEDDYCDKCPYFGYGFDFQAGSNFWEECRKKDEGHYYKMIGHNAYDFPSNVVRPDWCPLK